jgi:AraC-like DNA-binding protein
MDIVCTYGPDDRPFEEHFLATSISLVLAGTFVCRSRRGASLMSPGALLLGNCGFAFECSHQHGEGDRCLSFQFQPDLFERIAYDVGAKRAMLDSDRLPPLRELAPLSARASMAVKAEKWPGVGPADSLEEIALGLAGTVISMVATTSAHHTNQAIGASRIGWVLRRMEADSHQPVSLIDLAREAGLSPYHFLRTFKRMIGITPHQWLLRMRLRNAAERLVADWAPITEVALDVGFDDLSNFIRTFRSEFGLSPSRYRAAHRR